MSRSKETRKKVSRLTGGLIVTALDLTVLTAALGGGLILSGPGPYDSSWKRKKRLKSAAVVADSIYSKWDRSKFRSALSRALGKGLFERVEEGYQLTRKGKKRLKEILPEYKQPQAWDGRLWLITYDVAEDNQKQNQRKRDLLRKHLEKTGCGMIQRSVWLSVKDPRDWLGWKINDLRLKGSVIISCLGKDGSLGEEDVQTMVARVFKLKRINQWYQSWIKAVNKQKTDEGFYHYGLKYLAILDLDPVIPRGLSPADWAGERAREIFEKKCLPKMGSIEMYLR